VVALTLDALKGAVAVLLAEQFGEAPDAATAARSWWRAPWRRR
jgi:hypothetical protein